MATAWTHRRDNLRCVVAAQNNYNKPKYVTNTSGYKGVHPNGNGWQATLRKDGKTVFSKYFRTPEEAARAYDRAAKQHFGEFAHLNFPE